VATEIDFTTIIQLSRHGDVYETAGFGLRSAVYKFEMFEKPARQSRKHDHAAGGGPLQSASQRGPKPDAIPGLELRLFGPMEVRIGSLPLAHLRSRKGLFLLALLALRGGRDVDRAWIAGTLWPDCDEAHGRQRAWTGRVADHQR
jgi:hypothetical protein